MFRVAPVCLVALTVALSLAPMRARAQSTTSPPQTHSTGSTGVITKKPRPYFCTGCTTPPPVITFIPSTTTDTNLVRSQKVTACGAVQSVSGTFNGAAMPTFVGDANCKSDSTKYTLNVGTNTFATQECSFAVSGNPGTCGTSGLTVTHPAMRVWFANNNNILWANPQVTATQGFTVSNFTATQQTFTLSVTCSGTGIASCSAPPTVTVPSTKSAQVNVTVNTTSIVNLSNPNALQFKATAGSYADSVSEKVYVLGNLNISTAFTNQEDQDVGRCINNCFANVISMTTPAYISRDQHHAISLVYNSDRVAVRPILAADIQLGATDSAMSEIQFSAQVYNAVSGSWNTVNFFNSDANGILHFAGGPFHNDTIPFRIGGQFDASAYQLSTGSLAVYPLRLVITAIFAGHTEQVIDTTHHLMLFNSRVSPIANGWTISSVSQHGWGIVSAHTDQSFIMQADGNGSARLYGRFQCSAPGCVWPSPAGAAASSRFHYDNLPYSEVDYSDSSKEIYSPAGFLTARIDRLNDTVTYTYDTQNRVTQISDAYRRIPGSTAHTYWTLTYDGNGLSSIIEPSTNGTPGAGRTTHIRVDGSHLLRTWTDPDSDSTTFGYDASQRLDSVTDRNRNLTRYAYDPNTWKLDSIISPPIKIDSNSTGVPVTASLRTYLVDPLTRFLPTSTTSSTNLAPPFRTDSMWGYVINPAGHAQHFQLDRWGQYSIYDTPTGYVTSYARNVNGHAVSVTNSGGRVDSYSYSGTMLTWVFPYMKDATFYQYGPYAQLQQISGNNQPTEVFSLGVRGHTDSVKVNGVTKSRYYADAMGRDTLVIDAQNDTSRYTYDSATGNQSSATTSPGGRYRTAVFDGEGRDSVVHTSGGATHTTFYDRMNRVVADSDGVHPSSKYLYDGLYLTQVTDPKNQVYTITYNALGWATTRTDPTSRSDTTTYNGYGLPATKKNRNGQRISYIYDNMARVTSVHRPAMTLTESDTVETFAYTVYNDIVTATNGVSTDITYYNRAGGWVDSAVTTYLGSHVFKRFYHRDTRGRVDSVGVSTRGGVTGFDPYARKLFFDAHSGLIDSLHLNTTAVSFRYNVLGQVDSVFFPGGVVRADTYTPMRTLATTTWSGLGLYRGYGYDSAARVNEIDRSLNINGAVDFFGYTTLGQLNLHQSGFWADTLVKCINGQGYGCGLHRNFTLQSQSNFTFDGANNLSDAKTGTADTSASFVSGNRLSGWGNLTFAGDSQGNRVTTTVNTAQTKFVWGVDGRLLVDSSGSGKFSYDYNAGGQLVRRSTNGVADRYYLWDGGQLLAILDGTATNRVAEFVSYPGSQDQPLARITGTPGATTLHFYAQDVTGNVIAQFSGASVEQTLSYDPWGAAAVSSSTGDTTQLRWKGLLYEDGARLYYVRARWYDPVTRRFISPDPTGLAAGVNQYAYGNGDPLNATDHNGFFPDFGDSTPPNPLDTTGTNPDSTLSATTTDPALVIEWTENDFQGAGITASQGLYLSWDGWHPSDIGSFATIGSGAGADVSSGPSVGATNNTNSINGGSDEVAASIPPAQVSVSSNDDGKTVTAGTAVGAGGHVAHTETVTISWVKVAGRLIDKAERRIGQVMQDVENGVMDWVNSITNPMGLPPDPQ